MIGVVGASLGPLPLGIAFDLFGDYQFMLLTLAGLPVVAGVLTQFLKEPTSAEKDNVSLNHENEGSIILMHEKSSRVMVETCLESISKMKTKLTR